MFDVILLMDSFHFECFGATETNLYRPPTHIVNIACVNRKGERWWTLEKNEPQQTIIDDVVNELRLFR